MDNKQTKQPPPPDRTFTVELESYMEWFRQYAENGHSTILGKFPPNKKELGIFRLGFMRGYDACMKQWKDAWKEDQG